MHKKLKNLLLEVLKPKGEEDIVAWIGENCRQPDGEKYSWEWAHVVQEVVRSVVDTPQTSFVCIPQAFKTSTAIATMEYFAHVDPGVTQMAVTTNDQKIKEFRDLQLFGRLEHSEDFREYIPKKHLRNKKLANIGLSPLVLASGQSTGDAKSTPVKYLFLDETDEYKPYKKGGKEENILDLYKHRTNSYKKKGAREFAYSTPSIKAGNIWQEYLAGDQSDYYVECPCCKNGFVPTIADYEFGANIKKQNGEYDLDEVKKQCHIKCIDKQCKGKITDKNKWESVLNGKWIPKYPERSLYHRSFRANALLTTNFTIFDICKAYIDAKKKKNMHGFYNAIMALPYDPSGVKRDSGDLVRISTYANYVIDTDRLIIPTDEEGALVLACDVQMLDVPYVLRFVTENYSYLIDYGHFADLDTCRDYMKNTEIIDKDGDICKINRHVIDTGHKAKKPDGVYLHIVACNKMGISAYGIRGIDTQKTKLSGPISNTTMDYQRHKIPVFQISDKFFKDRLYNNIIPDASKGEEGWFLPTNICENYKKQLTSETLFIVDEDTGEQEWKKKGKNDFGDCEKYALAYCDFLFDRLV